MKKTFTTLITICALVLAQTVSAANVVTTVTVNSIEYTLYDDNTAAVTNGSGATVAVELPSTIQHDGKDYTLTTIGNPAFCFNNAITSVTIPNSVTTIGECAFRECSSLISVTIPNSVTTIGIGAFYKCSGLTEVTIPNAVTTIEESAFGGCSGLTSVTIPNSVTTIEKAAFRECSSLISVTIPNSVTTIGDEAFSLCSGLTSVTIPNSVSTIGNKVFSMCSSLKTVTVGAFVQSIGEFAFAGCSALTQMIFYPSTPPAFGESFVSSGSQISVYVVNTASYGMLNVYDAKNILRKFSFGVEEKTAYIGAVVDAITLAADRVALTPDEETAIYGYKAAINSADDVQSVPANELAAHRVIAIAGIRPAIPGEGWTEEEQTVMDGKYSNINNATSLAEIYTLQEEALAFIALHPKKQSALADIEAAKQGVTNSAYLNDLVKEQVAAINSATDAGTINSNKTTAVDALNIAVPSYKAALSELPTEGTSGNGVRITLGTKTVELMNPDKVEFFKK